MKTKIFTLQMLTLKRTSLVMFLFFMLLNVSFGFTQPTKHALIIAIGDYPKETDWGKISSVNDIELLKGALTKQDFTDFAILKNEEATKAGIIEAFKALVQRCKSGDIVTIHISSHGQQIWDNNDDEFDGYDEAIVAYGAPAYFDNGYKGENHLRDEELGELIDDIRIKLGDKGDLMVFLDACHSGSGTRGNEVSRGGMPAMAPPKWKPNSKNVSEDNNLFENRMHARGNITMAPYVVFSAARADELNYEYRGFGSLSVAINRSLENLEPGISYRTIFARILKEMSVLAPRQNPVAEGDMDRVMFGGQIVNQVKYYNLNTIQGSYVTLAGGMLNGLFKDSEVAIYPAGTTSTKGITPLAKGKISVSEPMFASLQLDVKLTEKPISYWAVITKQTFGDLRLRIKIDQKDKNLAKSLETEMSSFGLVEIVKENAELEIGKSAKGVCLKRISDATVINDTIKNESGFAVLKGVLSSYVQGRFIKELDMNDPAIKISMELIPVRIENKRVADTLKLADFVKNGVLELKPGDRTLIRVTNNSKFPVYFNIIDIQPDGKINALVPDPAKNENPRDFKLEANSTYIIPRKVVNIGPPYGGEVFKIFASYDPIDLSQIVASKGDESSRGPGEKPFETLFRNSYNSSTRGGDVGELSSDSEATTFSIFFKIVELK